MSGRGLAPLLFVLGLAGPLAAQEVDPLAVIDPRAVVVDPKTIAFSPSADHATLVTSYRLDIEVADAPGTVVRTTDLGKPAPVNQMITVPLVAEGLTPDVVYAAFIGAVGASGSNRNRAPDTFRFTSAKPPAPAAPTTIVILTTLTPVPLPPTGWTATASSVQTGEGDYEAANAIDGDPASMWHTVWSPTPAPYPHTLTIDLGASQPVTGFTYLPRQDGDQQKGHIAQYEFLVSPDGTTWGSPVAIGTLASPTATLQTVICLPKAGRYVQLRALTEQTGAPFAAAAEVGVLVSGS
jgi:hypothetical protein